MSYFYFCTGISNDLSFQSDHGQTKMDRHTSKSFAKVFLIKLKQQIGDKFDNKKEQKQLYYRHFELRPNNSLIFGHQGQMRSSVKG